MSGENGNLIAVLAAIDDAVYSDRERRDDVAEVFPPYRDSDVVGWFKPFQKWVTERSSDEADFPSLKKALGEMADETPPGALIPPDKVETESAATRSERFERPSSPISRRLRALAGLGAALPGQFGPEGTDAEAVVLALRPLTADKSHDQAEELHRQGSEELPVSSLFEGSLLMMPIEGDDNHFRLVPVLETKSQPLSGHTIREVEELLEPTKWSTLSSDLWEPMTPVGEGVTRLTNDEQALLMNDQETCFQEVFVVTPTFKLRPILEFFKRNLTTTRPPARSLEYHLCSHPSHIPQHPGPRPAGDDVPPADKWVIVDEGAIVNRELTHPEPGCLTVTATKRVAFDGPFGGAVLVMVAHAIGYQDAFEDMVEVALDLSR